MAVAMAAQAIAPCCSSGRGSGAPMASRRRNPSVLCRAVQEQRPETRDSGTELEQPNADDFTRKYGLEAGLWKIFTSKDDNGDNKKVQAKELLARYGGAYLATSISLSAVSFSLCYVLINAGVDVASLLAKVGIQTNETSEKVGAVALAYAAHKAASPIRFPPTVALTPIVAGWFAGAKPKSSSSASSSTSASTTDQDGYN